MRRTAEALYCALEEAGVEVLFDDRDASPGVKFTDADLRGMPLRITVSERSLRRGGVEFGRRRVRHPEIVAVEDAPRRTHEAVDELFAELAERKIPTWETSCHEASLPSQAG